MNNFIISPYSQSLMVGLNGLEPSTSRLSGVRSNQLSYRPIWVYKDFCERIESFKTKHNR